MESAKRLQDKCVDNWIKDKTTNDFIPVIKESSRHMIECQRIELIRTTSVTKVSFSFRGSVPMYQCVPMCTNVHGSNPKILFRPCKIAKNKWQNNNTRPGFEPKIKQNKTEHQKPKAEQFLSGTSRVEQFLKRTVPDFLSTQVQFKVFSLKRATSK